MICVACGNEAGYNRAVIDVHRRVEVGGLCVGCEQQHLDTREQQYFDDSANHRADFENGANHYAEYTDKCRFCNRSGVWALPLWCPSTYRDGDRVVSYVDYDVESTNLLLCDEHLNRTTGGSLPESISDGEEPTETVPE